MLPGISCPRFVSRLSRTGDGVKPPGFLPGFSVKGRDETADTVLTATGADDHLVLHHKRGQRYGIARGRIGAIHVRAPHGLAVMSVEGDEASVDRAHEQGVAENREP